MHGIELFFSNTLFGRRVYSYFLKEHPKILEYWKIHPKNFDFNKFQKKYFTVDYIQDISANPSSNVTNKSIARFKVEMITPFIKYLTFSTLFEKMVEMYGINEATEYSKMLLDGTFYLHDTAAYIMPYCLGVDFSKLLLEGMPYGQLHSLPPKKPRTFINQVKEAIIELSSEFAGAIAFPSLIILYTYVYLKYYGKDCNIDSHLSRKEIEDDFQNLVHTINKEMRNGTESPFSNLSFFDRYILDELLTYVYSYFTNEIGDKELFLKRILEIQEIVMEFLCKGDPITKAPYRFPVLTSCFIKDKKTGKILDREFLDLVAKNNTKGQMNIYVSDDARKYSLCCRFQPDITTFKFDSFGNGGINVGCYDEKTEVLTNRGWKYFKDLKEEDLVLTLNMETGKAEFQKPTHYFEYEYEGIMHHYKSRDIDLLVTPNHNMLVKSRKTGELKLIKSEDLNGQGYNLPVSGFHISKDKLGTITIGNKKYDSKAFCKFLGFFLADGSCYLNEETAKKYGWEISFSVKKSRKVEFLKRVLEKMQVKYNKYQDRFAIYEGKEFYEFLRKFYDSGNKKCIDKDFMLKLGYEDLLCLFEGLIEGDGYNNKKANQVIFYTSSDKLKDDFCYLCALIGYQTTVRKKGNPRIRETYFKKENRVIIGKCYEIVVRRNKEIHKIVKYKQTRYYKGKVYCVEVPNHILMVRRNGHTLWCGNSIRVLTINLNRIALEVLEQIENNFDIDYKTIYLQKLKERMNIAKRILDSFRECVRDFIKQGCYRFFNLGWFDLDKHFYSTIGFIGLYEALRTLDENLRNSFAIDILETMDDMITEFNKNGKIKYNLEQVPGESAAGLLPSLDKYFYGEEKVPYVLYSNQFVPLYERHSILDKIEIEGRYFKYLSGGGISHINILHEMKPEEVKFLIELCVEKGIEHFALNPVYSICENGHYLLGKYDECYICGAKIKDHLTRIVGFFTPVSAWSKQRREWEFSRRVWNTLEGGIKNE